VILDDGRLSVMKSHDCHVFMQDLLLPAFQGVLDEKVLKPLVKLSNYFKKLHPRTLNINILEQMEKILQLLFAS